MRVAMSIKIDPTTARQVVLTDPLCARFSASSTATSPPTIERPGLECPVFVWCSPGSRATTDMHDGEALDANPILAVVDPAGKRSQHRPTPAAAENWPAMRKRSNVLHNTGHRTLDGDRSEPAPTVSVFEQGRGIASARQADRLRCEFRIRASVQ